MMEIAQAPPPDEADRIRIHPGRSPSFDYLSKVFKSLKVPRHEPIPLSIQPQTRTTTTDTQIVKSPKIPRSSPSLTSINGHPAIELADHDYAIPTMPVAPEHMQMWESRIKDRLFDELVQRIRTERCHLEFFVVSDKKGRTSPCIILNVWDGNTCQSENGRKKTRRRVQKIVRSLQSLRDCQFECKVVIDTISLLAQQLESISVPEATIHGVFDDATTTFAGHLINGSNNDAQEFTLGGLIRVGSKVFGLTVAHPFSSAKGGISEPSSIFLDHNDSDDTDTTMQGDTDDDVSNDSNDTELVDSSLNSLGPEASESDLDRPNSPSTASEESNIVATVNHASAESQVRCRSYASFNLFGRIWTTSLQTDGRNEDYMPDLDWALVELDTSTPLLPNTYVDPGLLHTIQIDACGTYDLDPHSEVVVLGGKSGPIRGLTGQKDIDLRIEGRKLIVTQIVLNRTLQPGDSGAWVVRNQAAIGCIVAGKKVLPVAYMVPMTRVFDDIAQVSESRQGAVIRVDFIQKYAEGREDSSERRRMPDMSSQTNPDGHFDHNVMNIAKPVEVQSHSQSQPVIENFQKQKSTQADQFHEEHEKWLVPSSIDFESQITKQQPSLSPVTNYTPPLIIISYGVTFDKPSDPMNPKNWNSQRRWFTIATLILLVFSTRFAAYMIAPALNQISRELHLRSSIARQAVFSCYWLLFPVGALVLGPVSELYGRLPVLYISVTMFLAFNIACGFAYTEVPFFLFRIFSGLGGSTVILMARNIAKDMLEPKDLGTVTVWLWLGERLGTILGPILGAWIAERASWSWVFRSSSVAFLVPFIGAFLLKESYHPLVLFRKARKLRRDTLNGFLRSEGEGNLYVPLLQKVTHSVGSSLHVLGTRPLVQLLALYIGFFEGAFAMILSTIPSTFVAIYDESVGISGLNYISVTLGLVIGIVSTEVWRSRDTLICWKPENSLSAAMISALLVTIGLLDYGWSLQARTHWIVPNLGLTFIGTGANAAAVSGLMHLKMVYGEPKTSIVSAVVLIESLASFGFPLCSFSMYDAVGYGWGNTILALSGLSIGGFVSLVLWMFGKKLRRWERSKDAENRRKTSWSTSSRLGILPVTRPSNSTSAYDLRGEI